jgi:prepilin-type N-terminal cleavage/methylation domain-containing protein
MMKFKDGFSLVEIMVVIAIVGILSVIAIPFADSFMMRAKRVEAQTQLPVLSALYATYLLDIGNASRGGFRTYEQPYGKHPTTNTWDCDVNFDNGQLNAPSAAALGFYIPECNHNKIRYGYFTSPEDSLDLLPTVRVSPDSSIACSGRDSQNQLARGCPYPDCWTMDATTFTSPEPIVNALEVCSSF